MNEKFQKLALDAGVLNYIDNETPRVYFVSDWADLAELEDYGRNVLNEVFRIMREQERLPADHGRSVEYYIRAVRNEFGIL